jgi:hypothetical protein
MNRPDYLRTTVPCLGYTNLSTYQTHGPPYYGRGVKAPYFASTPMRTAFARGNCSDNQEVPSKVSCCDNYKFVGYPNLTELNKMIRCKKP